MKEKKEFRAPHVYIILLTFVVVCGVLTYILPAGRYSMVEGPGGRRVVDPDSFEYVGRTPVSFFGMAQSVPEGIERVAQIIFFIFIVGGSFYVLQATGAIEAGLGRLTKKFMGKERVVIPIIMIAFALGGATFGMAEETIPFVPIMISLALALGFDSIVGFALVFVGAVAGFGCAFLNPFTVGVAHGIAELPLFSGMGFRIVMFSCMTLLSTVYVIIYAGKIKKKPELSLMYEFDKTRDDLMELDNLLEFTTRRKIVLLVLVATIITLVVGVTKLDWYLNELSALFLIMGFAVAIIGGLGLDGFAKNLAEGMAGITGGAMVVGFARAILIVLENGQIIHTILHAMASVLGGTHSMVGALGMYVFQCLLNVPIPSGSGQAAATMPIMAPLSDLLGVTRQTAVVAFQLGDGISNILTPTAGPFMAGLALAKVPWDKWVKWFLPLAGLQYLLGAIFVIVAQLIHLGPF